MKIYFISSPRGKKKHSDHYKLIYSAIERIGHKNVTDFIVDVEVEKFYLSDIRGFYKKTISDLKKADICIFEVSEHSLAVGQLISSAIEQGKPVIALHTKGKRPFFLSGVDDEKVQIVEYVNEDIDKTLKNAIEYASEVMDTRFNFFISAKQQRYLDWVAKTKRIPRAVYLRRLIDDAKKKEAKYS